jgi:hypothetical protein
MTVKPKRNVFSTLQATLPHSVLPFPLAPLFHRAFFHTNKVSSLPGVWLPVQLPRFFSLLKNKAK